MTRRLLLLAAVALCAEDFTGTAARISDGEDPVVGH
jgi:hypothetical protein